MKASQHLAIITDECRGTKVPRDIWRDARGGNAVPRDMWVRPRRQRGPALHGGRYTGGAFNGLSSFSRTFAINASIENGLRRNDALEIWMP